MALPDGGATATPDALTSADVRPGRLIVFEGPDGVGKSTVAGAVATALPDADAGGADGEPQPRECDLMSFPGREPGTLGRLVYTVHHDPQRFGVASVTPAALQTLHIAAHLEAIERRIVPALRAGRDVVLDRFWWSTLVYGTVAGLHHALLAALIDVERRAWGAYRPTLAVLLRRDAPIERDEEDRTRWMALRGEYDRLAAMEEQAHPVLVVNSAPSANDACDQVLAALRRLSPAPWPPPTSGGPASSLGTGTPGGAGPDTPAKPKASHARPASGRRGLGHTNAAEQITIPIAAGPTLGAAVATGRTSRPARPTATSAPSRGSVPQVFVPHLAPAKVTVVYETYWRFAAERQRVFFRRVEGAASPWTDDPILATYKFTNAYRAADRVSQYLIRQVIYRDDLSSTPDEVCFRILLFKLFNKIETWQLLERELGPLTWADFRAAAYDRVLAAAMARGRRIYSAAYIMPPGGRAFGHTAKHQNHLALLERMMTDAVPARLADARSMQQAFEVLRSYPTIGDFLAYQFVTDINYSEATSFSEMEFVVPGPGALSGIRKCFADTGGLNEPEVIRLVTELQSEEFRRLGREFRSLWGRPLQLIDCQNLFCEVDKYARVYHPDVPGRANRTQIKQRFAPAVAPIDYWFPPKWQLNARIVAARVGGPQCGRENRNGHRTAPDGTLELLPPAAPSRPPT